MSALVLLSLLGIALFIPVLDNDQDDGQEPVDPPEPEEPPVTPEPPVSPEPPVDPQPYGVGTPEPDTFVTTSDQTINGFEGNDTITANEAGNGATVNGGADDDSFFVTGTGIEANGGRDADTFELNGVDNRANGGRGDDSFNVLGTGNTANGNFGNDEFSVDGNGATVDGGAGDDTINALEDNSGGLLNGGLGNDAISAGGTDVTINGDEGNDTILYSAASGTAFGNIGDDTMTAMASDRGLSGTMVGNGGDDVLSVVDVPQGGGNMLLNGGDGDDRISTSVIMNTRSEETGEDTLTGGRGDDTFTIDLTFPEDGIRPGQINIATITDFNRGDSTLNIISGSNDAAGVAFDGLELSVAADGSYTDVIATYVSLTEGVAPTEAIIRVLGVDNLSLSDINLSTGDATTAGDDYISSGGIGAEVDTISGGAGDDLLLHEGRDDAGPLAMQGGEGNDTIIASEVEFSNASTLDGGAGDDLLVTEIFTQASNATVDTFITGAGADTIEITTFDVSGDTSIDVGLAANVTDFTVGEDMIVIDTAPLTGGAAASFTQSVTLTENLTENYTDVRYVIGSDANANTLAGTVRLEGLTGLSEADIGLSLSDPAAEPADRPAYLYAATSET